MAKAGRKYYVVWVGAAPGIYTSWEECKKQIAGFPGAKYKSYPSKAEAEKALNQGPETGKQKSKQPFRFPEIPKGSIAVDAACSGNPGVMEYRGVDLNTGKEIFHRGPFRKATNNIGEFLAIVHALALLKKTGSSAMIFSDSRTALAWLRNKKAKTELPHTRLTEDVWDLIHRAENWLKANEYKNRVIKWETEEWGEIPADFGRK